MMDNSAIPPAHTCPDTAEIPSYSSTLPSTCIEDTEASLTPSYITHSENTVKSSSSTVASPHNTDIKNTSEDLSYHTAALCSTDSQNNEVLFYTSVPSNNITDVTRRSEAPLNASAHSAIDSDAENWKVPTCSLVPSTSNDNPTNWSMAQRVSKSVCSLFRYCPAKEVPKADKLLILCIETIQKLAQHLSMKDGSEDYVMNKHQCDLVVRRLVSGTQATLAQIQQSPLLDEKTIPVLQELHQIILDAERLIRASCITTSQWPGAAIEQGDMKETFSKLLYDVQWYTSVLQSILVDNSKESRIKFEPALCGGQLTLGDELDLLTAMKKDEESLKRRLRSVKLDDPKEQGLAVQLLNHMEALLDAPQDFLTDQHGLGADQSLDQIEVLPSDIVFLNPDDIELGGKFLGRGGYGDVRITKFLGKECAMKIIYIPGWTIEDVKLTIGLEMNAIKELGHHPNLVRLLCYSIKADEACYLIMEKMQMDLFKCLCNRKVRDKEGKEKFVKLSDVDAVSLMLQIGEGMEYIHSKGMVHRDLKPQNVLVNLENPSNYFSRICSVKIADFGLTKSKDGRTCSNNTVNTGTSSYMAPEVMSLNHDDPKKARFNPGKADVYSFALMCSVILTGWVDPYTEGVRRVYMCKNTKKQVKDGMRPNLPPDCLPRLATLIKDCWAGNYHDRPLFPEICRELRYIKGLLLKGDEKSNQKLQTKEDIPFSMEGVLFQGPWGGKQRAAESMDVATSIKQIELRYNDRLVACMEVTYELLGMPFRRTYSNKLNENVDTITIMLKQFEFITRISGFYSEVEVRASNSVDEETRMMTITCIVSLSIHTNRKSYGPYGEEKGEPFTSGSGRIIGFLGAGNGCLDRIGVVIVPGDMN
ncbi:hypothetical protein KC19_6G013000 [Ceratodon purpureus]|uniref:Protein kinase domain-containing protein n=1 Tax=Ceratodon purpureus TaxID=3225 RepID=A0A8T0HCF8_CERPU|nr:hypothetical protein KC19_6G013000 [Ceratodon purpureus]